MTAQIVIDESGDLGRYGSISFCMAAIVMFRARHLLRISKMIPNDGKEHKWSNTDPEDRKKLFTVMSECQFQVVYLQLDKENSETHNQVFGNELYELFIRQILADAMSVLPCRDADIRVDRCRFITLDRLREIANEEAAKAGINIKKCEKVTSHQNRCVQIVDYVVGAVRADVENGDNTLEIIREKISVARRY